MSFSYNESSIKTEAVGGCIACDAFATTSPIGVDSVGVTMVKGTFAFAASFV
jgi:hypothetical protein